ncbi:MAG: hypothetical protein V7679_10090 [Parasphingorhabdus sp.]
MSLSFDDCGDLVRAAICLTTGHRDIDFYEEKKKLVRFTHKSKPLVVIEKLKDQLNVWVAYRPISSAKIREIKYEERFEGFQKDGAPAKKGRPGYHSGTHGYLKSKHLNCFHPKSLEELWAILEEITK